MTIYKIVAQAGYDGHKKGEKVEADPDDPTVRRLVARGSLVPVTEKPKKKTEEVEDDA